MFAEDTKVCFAVPGQNATVELSAEAVRSLLSQVEVELHRSEVFRRALQGLEASQQDEASGAQFLLKAVGREAIRLALRQLVCQPESTLIPHPAEAEAEFEAQIVNLVPGWRKRVKPEQKADQTMQERQVCLQQLGEQIRRSRTARLMSLNELHSQTMIPLHQLQAIEAGHGAHFPEDIYLRGFVRRIAAVLGVDADRLLDSLPAPDPAKAFLPSWKTTPSKSRSISLGLGGLSLRPIHLYVGYAALVAGGFAVLSQQQAPQSLPNAIDLESPTLQKPAAKPQPQSPLKVSAVSAPERL